MKDKLIDEKNEVNCVEFDKECFIWYWLYAIDYWLLLLFIVIIVIIIDYSYYSYYSYWLLFIFYYCL